MSKHIILCVSRKYLLAVACIFGLITTPQLLRAQSVTVDANIDSLQIYIGDQAKIKLEVSLDAKSKLKLPLFTDTIVKGVEVIDVAKPDTQYLNDRQRLLISQEYTVTSFDSALYYLPPFQVMVDNKPYQSKALALKVYSVPVDTLHPEQFFGPKSIMEPSFAWEDWAGIIWLSLLAIPLLGLVIFFIIRYNDNKPIIRKVKMEPKLPPHQQAMQEIERIKAEKEWQKGRSKEYYTALTDTLRNYIKERFDFNAMEMTSSEIIERLREIEQKESIDELRQLFSTADLVKFAKLDPLMNENDMNLVNAVDFINQTKVEVPANQKTQPTEITIEEKRSKREKILLMSGIIVLSIAVAGILVRVGMDIYNLYF